MPDSFFEQMRNSGTPTGPSPDNIPLRVTGYANGAHNDTVVSGQRMDTGDAITVRLDDTTQSRDFSIAEKQHDWPVGSIIAVDGARADRDAGEGYFTARWINRIAKPDQGGAVRFAMGRCYYDSKDTYSNFKTKMEVVGSPRPVKTAQDVTEAAINAVKGAVANNMGWPKIMIAMRSPDGDEGYMKSWSVATAGESGAKSVAAIDAQRAHFQSAAFQRTAQQIEQMVNAGAMASVHAANTINFGRTTAKELDAFVTALPEGVEARGNAIKESNAVNDYTRFPLDESGETQFAPIFLGFQRDGDTLVGVRQLSGYGQFHRAADLPIIDNNLIKALYAADRHNVTDGRTPAPSSAALRGGGDSAPAPAESEQSAATSAPPANPDPTAADTPPDMASGAESNAPVQASAEAMQSPAASAPQGNPAEPATNASHDVVSDAGGSDAAPAAAAPTAQPQVLPKDVDELTDDLGESADIEADLATAMDYFRNEKPDAEPSPSSVGATPSVG